MQLRIRADTMPDSLCPIGMRRSHAINTGWRWNCSTAPILQSRLPARSGPASIDFIVPSSLVSSTFYPSDLYQAWSGVDVLTLRSPILGYISCSDTNLSVPRLVFSAFGLVSQPEELCFGGINWSKCAWISRWGIIRLFRARHGWHLRKSWSLRWRPFRA